jgi:hypothetical protein
MRGSTAGTASETVAVSAGAIAAETGTALPSPGSSKDETDVDTLSLAFVPANKGAWAVANPVRQKHRHKNLREVRCMKYFKCILYI